MNPRTRWRLRPFALFAALFAGGAVMASYDGVIDSVHFYGDGWYDWNKAKAPDFGRLPQRLMEPDWNNEMKRSGTQFSRYTVSSREDSWDLKWRAEREADFNTVRARNLEASGQFHRAMRAWQMSSESAGFKRDRLDAYTDAGFRELPGLADYLRDTYLFEQGNDDQQAKAITDFRTLKVDQKLQPDLDYAKACQCTTAPILSSSARGRAYFDIYRQFAHSCKAEPALIMAARTLLSWDADSGKGRSGGGAQGGRISAKDVNQARVYLKTLLGRFPHTRFRQDALGWQIRCDWLSGQDAKALTEYRAQAEHGRTPLLRWMGYESIIEICRINHQWPKEIHFLLLQRRVPDTTEHESWTDKELRYRFDEIDAQDARTVQSEIRREARLLESYVAFRIEDTQLSLRQERGLLDFALSSLGGLKQPTAELLARVAQIGYNDGRYRTSLKLAAHALAMQADGETGGQARYVKAASLARLGRYSEAIRTYQALPHNVPEYLKHTSQEHLALLQERHGDRVQALRSYYRLGYDLDVAFMADAEMTPAQLNRYIETYATPAQRGTLIYTLGMRFFRSSDFARAAATFERLSTRQRWHFGLPKREYKDVLASVTGFDDLPEQHDVLLSVRKLQRLELEAKSAKGPHKKARALYSMAAYMYKQRSLLYYSPGLWKGQRAFSICAFWNPNINTRSEKTNLEQYCHEHETLAHVMRLCRTVENLGIRGSIVAKALYTDGLASNHLGNLNEYWRGRPKLDERAINSMKRLVRLYPHDPLAKPAAKYAQVFVDESKPDFR